MNSNIRVLLRVAWQVGWLDRCGYEQELFEGHSRLAKAALTENEGVKFHHFVADADGKLRRGGRFRKGARLAC